MTHQLWQVLFDLLVLGAGVLSGVAVLGSAVRARGRPRGQRHRETPAEVVMICLGFLFMATAFWVAAAKAPF